MIKKSCIFIGQEDNLKLGALYRWKNTLKVVKKRALAKQGKTFISLQRMLSLRLSPDIQTYDVIECLSVKHETHFTN